MRLACMIACGQLLVTSIAGVSPAGADELVQVAAHRGTTGTATREAVPPLLGFLARPAEAGRHPAVVLLHWCTGFSDHDTQAADLLRSWGYVALALDSLGDANMCEGGGGSVAEVIDAYAALRYLAIQDFVAPERIAVMGYSMGGSAVLSAVERGALEQAQPIQFRSAVAYYPTCAGNSGVMSVPTLVLIGDRDDWTPAKACQDMVAHRSDIGISRPADSGAPVDLVVYPNVTHAFDANFPPHRYLGHLIEHDEAATQDALTRVRAFLRQTLGDSDVH